jgi:prolyl oligopeptidase
MKKIIGVILVLTALIGCSQKLKYPETKKVEATDDYFGTKVDDPYRWLEDDNSPETAQWVKEENKVTDEYLSKIPFRDKLKQRFEKLYNYPKFSAPFRAGKR